MDKGLVDWTEVLDTAMQKTYLKASKNNWSMDGLDEGAKGLLLYTLKSYYIKVEDYEKCNEIQEQLKTLNV